MVISSFEIIYLKEKQTTVFAAAQKMSQPLVMHFFVKGLYMHIQKLRESQMKVNHKG